MKWEGYREPSWISPFSPDGTLKCRFEKLSNFKTIMVAKGLINQI